MAISLEVFKDGDSAKLFSGQLVSQVCDKMMTLGLVWVVSAEKSSQLVPWLFAAGALPHLLLAWKAGNWASRLGPLKTAIATDFARGVLVTMAGLAWPYISSDDQVITIFALTFFTSLASALFNPAILSLPSLLAKEGAKNRLIPQLTALLDSCFSFSAILGPLIAALLYPEIGLRGLLVVNGLSYFFAAFLEATIRVAPSATGDAPPPPLGVFAVLKADPLLRFMLGTFFFINLLLTPMIAFLPLFATRIFHGQISTFAALETSMGIGMLAGALLLSVVHSELPQGIRAVIGMVAAALMYLVFSLNRIPSVAYACLLFLGLALAIVNVSMSTVFQVRTPAQDLPVVMSLVNLITAGALPFSMLLVGVLIGAFEVQKLALTFAVLMTATTFIAAFHREFRHV
jgi:DHA3 family macrolide efflux protein-like MFS transporter